MFSTRKIWTFVNKTPGYLVLLCYDPARRQTAFVHGVRDFTLEGRRSLRVRTAAYMGRKDK